MIDKPFPRKLGVTAACVARALDAGKKFSVSKPQPVSTGEEDSGMTVDIN